MTRLLWYNPIPNLVAPRIIDDLLDRRIGAVEISSRTVLESYLRDIQNATAEEMPYTSSGDETTPFVILDLPRHLRDFYMTHYPKQFPISKRAVGDVKSPFYFIHILTDTEGVFYNDNPMSVDRIADYIADEVESVQSHLLKKRCS